MESITSHSNLNDGVMMDDGVNCARLPLKRGDAWSLIGSDKAGRVLRKYRRGGWRIEGWRMN